MNICQEVLNEKSLLVQLRRHFHQHPEVSLKEFETCKKIEEELDRFKISHRRVGETGVYAWIDGKLGEGEIVALRADIDALAMDDLKDVDYKSQNNGVCHACGHDAHTATLLVASKILKAKENEFKGQIRIFFQQAEEIGQGGRLFVQEGLMKDVKRVFGVHVASSIDSGKISITAGPNNASCDYFKIEINGKDAHVSTPQKGVDALYIASQVVVNLQSIVSRCTDPIDTVVVGIGVLNAGTQYNIVAKKAEIEGTTRCFTNETREKTNQRVIDITNGICDIYGAKANITFKNYASPLINDEQACLEAYQVCKKIIDEKNIITNNEKSLGADDFADFLEQSQGVYCFLGTKNKNNPNTCVAQHNGYFDLDEDALLLSCQMYVDYALEILK